MKRLSVVWLVLGALLLAAGPAARSLAGDPPQGAAASVSCPCGAECRCGAGEKCSCPHHGEKGCKGCPKAEGCKCAQHEKGCKCGEGDKGRKCAEGCKCAGGEKGCKCGHHGGCRGGRES